MADRDDVAKGVVGGEGVPVAWELEEDVPVRVPVKELVRDGLSVCVGLGLPVVARVLIAEPVPVRVPDPVVVDVND